MLCVVAESELVWQVATPDTRATALQMTALPFEVSMKFTVPVGVPTPEERVAVNVTCWPWSDGLVSEVSTFVGSKRSTGVKVGSCVAGLAPPGEAGSGSY